MILKLLLRSMPTIMVIAVLAIPTQGEGNQPETKKPAVKIELLPDQEGVDYRVDTAIIANLERKIENKWQELGARKPTDPEVNLSL